MTERQRIDRSRERRLWVGQVIVPAIGVGVTLLSNPQTRAFCKEKFEGGKAVIKRHLPKKKHNFVVIK